MFPQAGGPLWAQLLISYGAGRLASTVVEPLCVEHDRIHLAMI